MEKLSYSSPKGTATEHGNGNSVQNFTATKDTKWRVLSIENGIVEIISENAIKTNDNVNFILNGGIGYLYAEQELNEVCKIFGYGYGADTKKGGTYTIGGPIDTPITGKIEGTGARSITIEDINKQAGVYEELASRCHHAYSNYVMFFVRNAASEVSYQEVCRAYSTNLSEINGVLPNSAVRPIVTLKSNVIDISTNYDSENGWKLK